MLNKYDAGDISHVDVHDNVLLYDVGLMWDCDDDDVDVVQDDVL